MNILSRDQQIVLTDHSRDGDRYITDHIWSIGELIDEALAEPIEQQAA